MTLALALCALAGARPASAAPSPLLPEEIRRKGVLTVATDAEYPPCESIAEDHHTIVGFDADLWNALGEKLGVRVVPAHTTFSGVVTGVVSGRYSIGMSCISDSVDRERRAIFIDYSYATSAIYSLASNSRINDDPLSVCGRKTAAEAGTDSITSLDVMSAHCVKRGRPGITILQFPSANAMFMALSSGRVDFVLDDVIAVDVIRSRFPARIRMTTSPMLPKLYTGIITTKTSQQLADAMLAALNDLHADGTYDRIMRKWNIAALSLDKPGVDLASRRPLPIPQP